MLDLPGGYENGNAAMMLSACHGKPIVQGETARKMGTSLADRLSRDPAALHRQLAEAKVKYIVLHRGAPFTGRAPRLTGYQTVSDSPGLTILRTY